MLDQSYQLLLLVPAMNEEAVIEQTMRLFLRETEQLPNVKMVIIDDASDDQTAKLVRKFIRQSGKDRIQLLQRRLPNAQTGKGNALNWAYRQLARQNGDPQHLICGILDADAYMSEKSYRKVIQYFANDQDLDLLQTRVGMIETHNWLQLMQDIEFVVINDWIQNTRNRLNNAAASGNGQFIRVSSVTDPQPWGNALLEDFEFSTRFLMQGKKTQYASDAIVYQEAIDKPAPFVRQRARWTQGGLDCLFGYWIRILRNPFIRLAAKTEMFFYMLIPFVTLVTGLASLVVFGFTMTNLDDYWRLLLVIVAINLSFNIYIVFQYQRITKSKQHWLLLWTVLTFAIYNYLLYPAIVIAFYKKVSGQTHWVKTTHGIKKKIGRKAS
ncbi:glycosyltransferase [Lactobacillus nasalidis]|uniref:glycosyltransferase n=1 Tax=Lactobacillus nasalidis TaxID=2797258 RepID=UPI001FD08560|nr:glycosyltransferase [Lactobacillus nasalidis]